MDEASPPVSPVSLSGWNRLGRWRLLMLLSVVVLLPVVAFLVGRRSATAEERIAQATPPAPGLITVPVERRTLETGEVLHARVVQDRVDVSLRLPADQVVTGVSTAVGDTLAEGQVLMTLDDRPLIVLGGDLPMIRALIPGDRGSIVEQLQRCLRRLGFYRGDVNGRFDPSTQEAVAEMYRQAGFTPPGQRAGAVGNGGASEVSEVTIPASEIMFLSVIPAEVVGVNVSRGSVASADMVLLSVTTGEPYVMVEESVPGNGFPDGIFEASLTLESVSGEDLGLAAFNQIETRADDSGGQIAVARFIPSTDLTPLVGEPVDLVAGREVLEGVLAVPVSAVHSDADGSTYIVVSDNGSTRKVEVVLGPDAGGYVALDDSADVAEGVLVVVGNDE